MQLISEGLFDPKMELSGHNVNTGLTCHGACTASRGQPWWKFWRSNHLACGERKQWWQTNKKQKSLNSLPPCRGRYHRNLIVPDECVWLTVRVNQQTQFVSDGGRVIFPPKKKKNLKRRATPAGRPHTWTLSSIIIIVSVASLCIGHAVNFSMPLVGVKDSCS